MPRYVRKSDYAKGCLVSEACDSLYRTLSNGINLRISKLKVWSLLFLDYVIYGFYCHIFPLRLDLKSPRIVACTLNDLRLGMDVRI